MRMEDQELRQRLDTIEQKAEAAYQSAEKTRRYLQIIVIVSVVALVLPLVGILFELPTLLSSYQAISGM